MDSLVANLLQSSVIPAVIETYVCRYFQGVIHQHVEQLGIFGRVEGIQRLVTHVVVAQWVISCALRPVCVVAVTLLNSLLGPVYVVAVTLLNICWAQSCSCC